MSSPTPLTEYQKALLSIASFDLQYTALERAVDSLLETRRAFSGYQSAVLTARLDDLAELTLKPKPQWPTK